MDMSVTEIQSDDKRAPHTPAPWDFEDTTLDIVRGILAPEEVGAWKVMPEADHDHAIAYVPSDFLNQEQEANARLIAAAPELLAALKGLYEVHHAYQLGLGRCVCVAHESGKAAIAKAEGRE